MTPPLKISPRKEEQTPEHPVNPAYTEAQKYRGKKETDSKFGAWLSTFWAGVGLKGYKTIIGSAFAWCGLFIYAMNTQVGQQTVKDAAAAVSFMKYGQKIDWKVNGIPKGAVVQINHNGDCGSGSGNHVTFADADCTPADLAVPGAAFPGFGGNQQNEVNTTWYSVKEICRVAWPHEIELPGKITKSINCSGKASSGSTTR